MNSDYIKRDYLLPKGCKDLIDVIKRDAESGFEIIDVAMQEVEGGFLVTALLPELRSEDFSITVEERWLRIVGRLPGGKAPFETVVEVPHGYGLHEAQATYIGSKLRILVPKAAA